MSEQQNSSRRPYKHISSSKRSNSSLNTTKREHIRPSSTARTAQRSQAKYRYKREPRQKTLQQTPVNTDSKLSMSMKVLIALGLILFTVGMFVTYTQYKTNNKLLGQVNNTSNTLGASTNQDTNNTSASNTSPESPPPSIDSHMVAPNEPRVIRIPSIAAEARVLGLALTDSGDLAAPVNVFDAGWYTSSAHPGDPGGAIVIDGHVSGPTQPGIFYNLKNLNPGDTISIERGDGQVFNFTVVDKRNFAASEVDMPSVLTSIDQSKLGLNLITCTGSFDSSTEQYSERVVVYAVAS